MRVFQLQLAVCVLAWIGGALELRAAPKWDPIDPGEFSITQSTIDPEAGAEVLFREALVDGSSFEDTSTTHYVRTRVYSERGVEHLSKIEIPYSRGTRVIRIEARTVKPDGTILELGRKDVFDREVLKAGNVRVKVKSFAPPGLEPGAIVEYRYTVIEDEPAFFFVLQFQGDLPARRVHYKVRLLEGLPLGIRGLFFNCANQALTPDKTGHYNFELTDLPGWKDEPFQPPEVQTRAVAVLYYVETDAARLTPEEHWRKEGIALHKDLEKEAKVTKAIRAALDSIVDAADTPGEKLQKIYDYCRSTVFNRTHPPASQARDSTTKYKKNSNATDTLRNASGTSYDINVLFAALVRAAGLDARFARCNDRDLVLFNQKLLASFIIPDLVIAVKNGEGWRYYSPGERYLPAGMLNWNNTGTIALISDRREPLLQEVPASPPDSSRRHREATLRLDPDGTLEGDVTMTYIGHWDAAIKAHFASATAEDHHEYLKDEIRSNLKLAEVSDVVVEHATDTAPTRISFHLRVPEFAERTGSRLFLQPAVFQKGESALFTATTRQSDVIFRYRYVESDAIAIQPPAGFTLEAASAPNSLAMKGLGNYSVSIGVMRSNGTIKYTRQLTMEGLFAPQKAYETLKLAFDAIHSRDNHVLTLKREEIADAAAETAPKT